MAKLSDEVKTLINEIKPALIATASKSGKPNVSAKGSFRVLDDETVIFSDVNSPRTVANLRENPQVSIICLNPSTRKSCRIWGTAEVINSGPLYDEAVAAMAARNIKPNNVVKIHVDEVLAS
ncbi:MAG: pyridoxamine 5'-phosphate oxidase family protein [Chloroflexi bacterium]|nr:pyridoxamine 5'-phosphate oxidase family protein [Chloroflexota bacterium]